MFVRRQARDPDRLGGCLGGCLVGLGGSHGAVPLWGVLVVIDEADTAGAGSDGFSVARQWIEQCRSSHIAIFDDELKHGKIGYNLAVDAEEG